MQLWHVGRRSNKAVADITPVSASAVKEADMVFGPLPSGGFGMVETSTPLAMTKEDIQSTVEDFVQAAKNAMEAGFDGVELHGAHGYLLEQFLYKASNLRTDEYGGSQENRMRFPLEVVEAVVDTIGAQHVAIRLSPFVTEGFNQEDPEIKELTLKLIEALDPYGLAYLHISENISKHTEMTDSYREDIRKVYTHPIMVAGQYNKEKALNVINNGYADLVAIGQPFITNPDYVYRIQNNLALNPVDDIAKSTFYGGDEKGYLDYPVAENV